MLLSHRECAAANDDAACDRSPSETAAPPLNHLSRSLSPGTYNNQWMIGDLHLFTAAAAAGAPLAEGSFVVAEEVPGLVVARDQSATLDHDRYWPSFNCAYYNETRAIAGDDCSYTTDVRAQLFAELQARPQ